VLIRCYWEGQERERICKDLGLSGAAVDTRKCRGRDALVKLVRKELRKNKKGASRS